MTLTDYALGKVELTKAQLAIEIKELLKDEEQTFSMIMLLYRRRLLTRFDEKVIKKMFKRIESALYASVLLQLNLDYEHDRFIKIVAKSPKISASVLIDQNIHLTDKEIEKLFQTTILDPVSTLTLISQDVIDEQLIAKYGKFILDRLKIYEQTLPAQKELLGETKYQHLCQDFYSRYNRITYLYHLYTDDKTLDKELVDKN